MRIALLSGAYGNAGDSLIEARSRALLENTFPGGAEGGTHPPFSPIRRAPPAGMTIRSRAPLLYGRKRRRSGRARI